MKRALFLVAGLLACGKTSSTIDILRTGEGAGRIVSEASSRIDCGDVCRVVLEDGEQLRLSAEPDARSTFAGWGDACTGMGKCAVTADGSKIVSARFVRKDARLVLTSTGAGAGKLTTRPGTLSCPGSCEADFAYGTRVEILATPNAGSRFAGFDGDCRGTSPCGVTMLAARAVRGRFEPDLVTLTVTRSGTGIGRVASESGAIDCGANCTADLTRHSFVRLTATSVDGGVFAGWSGACSGVGECRVTLDASKTVNAEFVAPGASLTVVLAGAGGGNVTSMPAGINCGTQCTAAFMPGSQVVLTAAPALGARFVGWSAPCVSTTNVCALTASGARSVVATFEPDTFTLRVEKMGRGRGIVRSTPGGIDCGATCDTLFASGTQVTLTATPEPGSRFVSWDDGCVGSGACRPTVNAATRVVARFETIRHTLMTSVVGTGAGRLGSLPPGIDCGMDCSQSFDEGTMVTLTPTPIADATFAGWGGACSGTGTCVVPIDGAKMVNARFEARYVRVSAATFEMGSPADELGRDPDEGPTRMVSLTRDFFIKATEVNRTEYRQTMGSDPSVNAACEDCPVESLTWNQAVQFLNTLSRMEGLAECYTGGPTIWFFAGLDCSGYRLPTEAEWERAARGGSQSAFFDGTATSSTCAMDPVLARTGWYCGNSPATPHPVGQKDPNAFGLYDVHGNVAELIHDWYEMGYYATSTVAVDPLGPTMPALPLRVIRGGSVSSPARDCRAAARATIPQTLQRATVGLRPVRTAP